MLFLINHFDSKYNSETVQKVLTSNFFLSPDQWWTYMDIYMGILPNLQWPHLIFRYLYRSLPYNIVLLHFCHILYSLFSCLLTVHQAPFLIEKLASHRITVSDVCFFLFQAGSLESEQVMIKHCTSTEVILNVARFTKTISFLNAAICIFIRPEY